GSSGRPPFQSRAPVVGANPQTGSYFRSYPALVRRVCKHHFMESASCQLVVWDQNEDDTNPRTLRLLAPRDDARVRANRHERLNSESAGEPILLFPCSPQPAPTALQCRRDVACHHCRLGANQWTLRKSMPLLCVLGSIPSRSSSLHRSNSPRPRSPTR